MTKIKIVDKICGGGKTQWAIQKIINMSSNGRTDKFLYVTPFLDEITRIQNACKKHGVKAYAPNSKNEKGSKTESLKRLMLSGKNIVTTHALFDKIDISSLELIKTQGYTLIMDEVHKVISKHEVTKNDLSLLINNGLMKIDKNTDMCVWLNDGYRGKHEDIKNLCKLGSLYYYSNEIFVWAFPASVFEIMKEVYVLTYMFEGQLQCAYYKMHNIDFEMYSVEEKNGMYELVEYSKEVAKKDFRKIKNLIEVYDGHMNYESTRVHTLSATYLEEAEDEFLIPLKNNILNYFVNIKKAKSDEILWTTIKSKRNALKGKGYSKGFLQVSARATNLYKDRFVLAYIFNRYLNPIEKNFFYKKDCKINQDEFSLSELIQWMFRSRIRDGKPISIFIPSKRMRDLLLDYLK